MLCEFIFDVVIEDLLAPEAKNKGPDIVILLEPFVCYSGLI